MLADPVQSRELSELLLRGPGSAGTIGGVTYRVQLSRWRTPPEPEPQPSFWTRICRLFGV